MMKTGRLFYLTPFLITLAANAAEGEKFSCSLTKYIEGIDGTLQPRDRQKIAPKDLPSSGQSVVVDKEVTDGAATDANVKKFRIRAKLTRGDRGRWLVDQKLFQVLQEGEREGEELSSSVGQNGKITSIDILRTAEQFQKGAPLIQYRLNCVVKYPSVEAPLVAVTKDIDGSSGTGTKVDTLEGNRVANLVIPYAPNFGRSDPKLDPNVFNRIVDPVLPPAPPAKPMLLVSRAAPEVKKVTSWKDIWPLSLLKKEETPLLKTEAPVVVAEQPVKKGDVKLDSKAVQKPGFFQDIVNLIQGDPSFSEKQKKQQASQSEPVRIQPVVVAPALKPNVTHIPDSVPLVLAPPVLEARVQEVTDRKISAVAPKQIIESQTEVNRDDFFPPVKNWKAHPVAESHPGFMGPPSPPSH